MRLGLEGGGLGRSWKDGVEIKWVQSCRTASVPHQRDLHKTEKSRSYTEGDILKSWGSCSREATIGRVPISGVRPTGAP
jgi:hypothetical protein